MLNLNSDVLENRNAPARRRLFVVVSVLAGLVLGLIILEAALRIVGYSSPEFYTADETLGYKLIAGMSGNYRKEGASFVTINSDGFRDVEHAIEKPADTFRLAIIGDSYVEAFQVQREAAFSNFVRDRLGVCGIAGPRKIEVLTFGVSGYGTGQELLMLRDKVLKYSPDMVMLVMTTNNDVTDNSRALKRSPIPYFSINGDELVEDKSFLEETSFRARNSGISRLGVTLKNHLRFVQAIGAASTALKYKYREMKRQPAQPQQTADTSASAGDIGIDNEIYREPQSADWQNAWQVTERLILTIKNEVERSGSRFVIVTASNGIQVLPDIEERRAYAARIGVADLLYPDRRIAAFCSANSIPVITLAPILGEIAAREKVFLHGFPGNMGYGHWNEGGHRAAGTAIGQTLCEMGVN